MLEVPAETTTGGYEYPFPEDTICMFPIGPFTFGDDDENLMTVASLAVYTFFSGSNSNSSFFF